MSAQAGHGLALTVQGGAVGDCPVAQAHVGQGFLVVDRRDGQGGLVGGGLAERSRVGVGRKRLVLAAVVAVRVGEGVTGCGVDGDARVGEFLVDSGEDATGVAAHARVVSE